MPKRLSRIVRNHVEKARECALLAVDIYNKPATAFRSAGYLTLMCIAWTSLFHAIYFRRGDRPFYRNRKNQRWYEKVEGDYKAWELAECVSRYFGPANGPDRVNLEFIIRLRNKIEHRYLPALDDRVFGECQATLFNFEDLLVAEFGETYALSDSLSLALQFSRLRDPGQLKSVARLHKDLAKDLREYLETFRSSLSAEMLADLRFSYKVFIVPKLANHQGSADLAVEFVRYDPSNPQHQQLLAIIKTQAISVANLDLLKASAVCAAVLPTVQAAMGPEAKFTASSHHIRAAYHYKVRPHPGDPEPMKTNERYCFYDTAHGDYLYGRLARLPDRRDGERYQVQGSYDDRVIVGGWRKGAVQPSVRGQQPPGRAFLPLLV